MGYDLIPKGGNFLQSLFSSMIEPDEVIEQVSQKTTVTTDTAEHTVWGVYRENNTAFFTNTKPHK